MKKIIDYFVDNSVIVNLISIMIVIIGITSVYNLNKETFPAVDFNFINITTTYPGAAAEEIERLVTIPIERELKGVDGIDELNGLSLEATSVISLKIDPDSSTDEVFDEVQDALSNIAAELPEDVKAPQIKKATNKNRSLMTYGIFGTNEMELRKKGKKIQDYLERDNRISRIEFSNYRDEVVEVSVDLKKLNDFDLTLSEVLSAIRDRQVNVSGGNLTIGSKEILVRTIKDNKEVEDIENIVIRSNDSGQAVLVKDLAKVERILEEKEHDERGDGKEALFIKVQAKSSADVISTANHVKKGMKELSEKLSFEYKDYQDLSFYVERRLSILSQNGLQGIFLVLICLIFFMNWRVSVITALGAPFAFLVAFSLMESLDVTLNLISMFGLILVLGMLVDDSIIVSEQYYQYLEKGHEPRKAAKKAAYDTLAPVTSTIITTMVAFSSLFFMDGVMGKFLWPVPAVIIICLLASWLECFFILPGHLADFASKVKNVSKERWYAPLLRKYEVILSKVLSFPKTTVLVFIGVFIGACVLASTMRFELFPSDDATYVYVHVKGDVGVTLESTNQKLAEIEQELLGELKKSEYKGIRTVAGITWSKGQGSKRGSHYGSIFLELTMQDLRERKTNTLVAVLNERVQKIKGDYKISMDKIKNGPPSGKPVSIDFNGEDFNEMLSAVKFIEEYIKKEKGVLSTFIDFEEGKDQILIKVKEKEARRLGVSNTQVALEVRNALEGLVATTIKEEEDVDIVVKLNKEAHDSEKTLSKLKIVNKFGQKISLGQIVDFERQKGIFVIRRLDGRKVITLSGEVDPKVLTARKLNKKLLKELPELMKKYPEIDFEVKGENKDTNDSLASFKKALVVSSFVIFIILVVQFSSLMQPLIIMSAIPLGLIGVVLSFKIFGMAIGFMALMGMLGLVGVVVNDSIVLVNVINKTIKSSGMGKKQIVEASVSRFRPVILTTFTTVVGLLPIAHTPGGDPFLKPMAVSFAYGLLFSTLLTLFFIPSCYFLYMKFLLWRKESLNP